MTGEELRQLREYARMDQRVFGKLIDYSQSHVSDMETGRRPVPDELAERLRPALIENLKAAITLIATESQTQDMSRGV